MPTEFNSSTPMDINQQSIDDVLKYVEPDISDKIASPRVRLNLTKMLYDVLGMTLTPDIALATVAEPRASLVLSTAGGGKTTWAQIKAILEKIMRKSVYHTGKNVKGDAILCLVYNKHNVNDMIEKHKSMVAKLEARGIKGLDIDSTIHACTLHSFCDGWRREYVAKLDLLGFSLLEQSQAESFMRRAIRVACKMENCEKLAATIDSADVLSLYTYYRETLCESISDLAGTAKFVDLGLHEGLIEVIFERYDRAKRMQRKYDFVDMLYKFYCLMRDDDSVRSHVQHFYEYVIADEVQDFTPLMWEILKLMVSDGTPLTCIGDEDQNIYSFRGADIYNTLEFDKMFDGGRIYSLEYNRRCGKRILDEARNIIEMNTLRFNKVLRNTKDGGSVVYEPYNTINGQFVNVIKLINGMSPEEQNNTVICYRESASSTVLVDMLVSEDIVFNVISGVAPFTHELYRHLFNILDALEMPYDMANCITLYKVLPCSKEEFHKAIGFDAASGKFKKEVQRGIHFKDYDYGELGERQSFKEVIQQLGVLSAAIESRPIQDVIQPVFQLLNKYFWAFKKSCNRFPDIDDIMQARILKFFKSPLVYSKFYQEYQRIKSRYNHYTESREGVTVSTFHSLKGLEFKNVIVVCMDDSIYPNFGMIDSKNYSPEVSQSLKEAEVRLWYVAVTRAKENLHVFYSKDNPSVFVRYALDNNFPVAGVFSSIENETKIDVDSELDACVQRIITHAKNSATPQKLDMFDDSDLSDLDESLDDISDYEDFDDELDDFENSEFMSDDAAETSEISIEGKLLTPAEHVADSSTIWRDTQDLSNETDPFKKEEISESEKMNDSSEKVEPTIENGGDEPVQLHSGKTLYVNRLLSSL